LLHAVPMNRDREDLLGAPFTPALAARAGVGRAALERLVREGEVVRLTRGVYLGTGVDADPMVRAQGLRLVVGSRPTVIGRTAAWLHGCAADALLVGLDPSRGVPVELRARGTEVATSATVILGGLRTVTPVVVAAGLSATLPTVAALAALDGLVRCGALDQRALQSGLLIPYDGPPVPPELAARCDGRADGPAESVLRSHWFDARLPTPTPGLVVGGARLALALPVHRFGVVLAGREPAGAPEEWRSRGWQVIRMRGDQVLGTEPALVRAHLEREFHRHLLDQVGAVEEAL
jgi:hypothetical protein